jgi:putative ABC transport system substrate-binding protein
MRRRGLITLLGGVAAWPLAAYAQQPRSARRIGFILAYAEDNPNAPPRIAAFAQGLQELGWTDGNNVHIDYRYTGGMNFRLCC